MLTGRDHKIWKMICNQCIFEWDLTIWKLVKVYEKNCNTTVLWHKQKNVAIPIVDEELIFIKSNAFWQDDKVRIERGIKYMPLAILINAPYNILPWIFSKV